MNRANNIEKIKIAYKRRRVAYTCEPKFHLAGPIPFHPEENPGRNDGGLAQIMSHSKEFMRTRKWTPQTL